MSDPFVAEIRMFGFNFAPTGWATCDGQLMPISQNTALFSLLGTTYGGDGVSTFGLPNLQGSAVMHSGQGPGLTERFLGEVSGSETVTLLQSEMPVHSHNLMVSVDSADEEGSKNPGNRALGRGQASATLYAQFPSATSVTMHPQALGVTGGSLPHSNMMPSLTMNFCIALQGIFPARN
jgi:microcystin-dependent protein